jgi:hypothetical protein
MLARRHNYHVLAKVMNRDLRRITINEAMTDIHLIFQINERIYH